MLPARLDVCPLGRTPFDSDAVDHVILAFEQQIVVLEPAACGEFDLRINAIKSTHARKLQQLLRLILKRRGCTVNINRPTKRPRIAPERTNQVVRIRASNYARIALGPDVVVTQDVAVIGSVALYIRANLVGLSREPVIGRVGEAIGSGTEWSEVLLIYVGRALNEKKVFD